MTEFDGDEDYYDQNSLFAAADLGETARSFLGSELGKYLLGCAKQDIDDASAKLLTVAPTNIEKIRELQTKAQTAGNFLIWINEAIGMGDVAYQQITTED